MSKKEDKKDTTTAATNDAAAAAELPEVVRNLLDELGLSVSDLKSSSVFSGDEELFAFTRALSRLSEMGSKEWVERGLGVGMDVAEGMGDREAWKKTRSRWREDNM